MSFPVIEGVEVVLEPPPGYEVNFDSPRHDHSTTNATIWLFCIEWIIGSFFFGQRMYTNGVLLKNFRVDDCKFLEKSTTFVFFWGRPV
jgi:hypothetical protein